MLLVEDVNDNEPVFKPYPSAVTVREDADPGILVTVEATDLDEGAYGQVSTPNINNEHQCSVSQRLV